MRPRKLLYLALCILSIAYIGLLVVDILIDNTSWQPDLGAFEDVLYYIVHFGGVALIFCYALAFCQGTLGVVCFIVFCVVLLVYVIITIMPDTFYQLFGGTEAATQAVKTILSARI